MEMVAEPACTPHAMFALSTQARTASSSPAPSPMSVLRFMTADGRDCRRCSDSSLVLRVTVQELDRVTQRRQDRLERFCRAAAAAGQVKDQRLATNAGE